MTERQWIWLSDIKLATAACLLHIDLALRVAMLMLFGPGLELMSPASIRRRDLEVVDWEQ